MYYVSMYVWSMTWIIYGYQILMKTKWKQNEKKMKKMKNRKKWKISLESSPEWEGLFFPGEAHDFKASLGYPSGYQPNSMASPNIAWRLASFSEVVASMGKRGLRGGSWPPWRDRATTGKIQRGRHNRAKRKLSRANKLSCNCNIFLTFFT